MGNCGGGKKKEPEPPVARAPPSDIELAKKEELARILNADKEPRKDGDAWFVVEAAWVHKWLTYVQGNDRAKRPGAIDNRSLLMYSSEEKVWKPKPLLRGARKEHMGHYRRVNAKVWELWCHVYEGSGPPIWVQKEPFENTSNWQLDPNFDEPEGSGLSKKANVGEQGGEGRAGAGPAAARSEMPKRLWPAASERLEIGDMEDDRVGDETKAQAAAFFDYVPFSTRTKADLTDDGRGPNGGVHHSGGGSAALAPPPGAAGNDAAASVQQNGVTAGEPVPGTGSIATERAGLGEGGGSFGGRAGAWMYGDGSE